MVDVRQSHDCGLTGVNTDFGPITAAINRDALAAFNNIVRLIQSADVSAATSETQAALDNVAEFMKGSIFGDLESFINAMGLPKLTKPPSRGYGSGGKTLGDPSGSMSEADISASKKFGTNVPEQARSGSGAGSSLSRTSQPRPSAKDEDDNERLAALGVANCFGTIFADSGDDNFASFRSLYIQLGRNYTKMQEVVRSMVSGEHLIVYSLVNVAQFKPSGGKRQEQNAIEAQLGFKLFPQDFWWDNDNVAYVPLRSYIAHNVPLWKISEKYDMGMVEITVYSIDSLPTTTGIITRLTNLGFSGQALQAVVSQLNLLELELENILRLLSGIYDSISADTVINDMKNAQQYINFRVLDIPDSQLFSKLIAKFGEERVKFLFDWRTDLTGMNLSMTSADLLRYLNNVVKSRAGSTIISNSLRSKKFDFIGKAQAMAYVCRNSLQKSKATNLAADTNNSKVLLNLLISYLGGLIVAEKIIPIISNEMSEKVSFFVDKSTRNAMGDMATAPGLSTNTTTSVSNVPANPDDAIGTTTTTVTTQPPTLTTTPTPNGVATITTQDSPPGTTIITTTTVTVNDSGSKVTTTEITTVKTQDGSTISPIVLDELLSNKGTSIAFTGERADADLKGFGSTLGDGQMIAGGQKSFDSPASLLIRNIDIDSTFNYTEKLQELANVSATELAAYGDKATVISEALKMTASILQATCGRMQSAIKLIFDAYGGLIKDIEALVSAMSALLSKTLTNCLFSVNLSLKADFMTSIVADTINNIVTFLEGFNKLIQSVVNMLCLGSCMITSLLGDLANILTFPCIKSIQLPNPIDELIRQIEAICLFASDLALKTGKSSYALKNEIEFAPAKALFVVAQSCKCSDYGFAAVTDALANIPLSLSQVIPSPKATPYKLPL